MDRVRELETAVNAQRAKAKAILAAASQGKRALNQEERDTLEASSEELRGLEATLQAERLALEWDRTSAPAIDRPMGEGRRGAVKSDEDASGLALPPLPARTRAAIASMAGGASAPPDERREHFGAVVRAALGGDPFHPLLAPLAGTSTEAVPSEGGFATRPDVAADIFGRAAEESIWLRIGARLEPMTSDERDVIALDDDDESGDKEAGLQAGWTGEATEATAQIMLLRKVTLQAKKLLVLAATSNELAEDGPAYITELEAALGRAIAKRLDRAIFSGTGAGQPLGILNAPATIEVSKTVDSDPGTANTFTWKHATGMWSRLAPGSHERSWWVAHPSTLPQLLSMSLAIGTGGGVPRGVFEAGGPSGYMLLGRPVLITGRVKPLSSRGDVVLLDPSQLAVGVRRSITIDRSPHVYFSSDRLAIRAKFRGDATPLWETPRTLQEGSTTVSPYVVLQAR